MSHDLRDRMRARRLTPKLERGEEAKFPILTADQWAELVEWLDRSFPPPPLADERTMTIMGAKRVVVDRVIQEWQRQRDRKPIEPAIPKTHEHQIVIATS